MVDAIERHYKRINFFRGFLTTEKDWNDAERYHVEKRKLHNRMLHGPGIVPHALGGFRVAARGRGELAVEVQPGYAIDAQGSDIFIWEPEIKIVNPADFKLPTTIYLVARYLEEFTDFISYKENLEYKGHRRVSEKAKLEWIVTEPDIANEVELCRVALDKDVKRITDAKDPYNPKPNEIDLRFVPIAGIVGTFIPPSILWELFDLIRKSKTVYAYLFHTLKVLSAGDVLHGFITFEMMLHTQLVDLRNVFALYLTVLNHQWGMVEDIDQNVPQVSSQRDFANYKKHVEIALQKYEERRYDVGFLKMLIAYQNECFKFLEAMFSKQLKREVKAIDKPMTDLDAIIEKIKTRSDSFEEVLTIDDMTFRRCDWIDPLEHDSETQHKFKIEGARDKYRTRQKLKYPDSKTVEDAGIAYEGGNCTFELNGIEPGKDVYVVWRMDYVHGDWEAEMHANDRRLPNCVCGGEDRKFRWRNWVYVVPGEHVREVTLRLKQVPITADRDINIFKLWAYQPLRSGG